MTARTELSAADITRQLVRLAYGDLTPFVTDAGYLTCSFHDLPAAAVAQISLMTIITNAAGTRIKLRAWGAVHKCQALAVVHQLEHHPDPAVRQIVCEERQAILGRTARRRRLVRRHHGPSRRCRVLVTHTQTSSRWIQ